MSKNYWRIDNTVLHTWFERDRKHVRLESDLGGEIISLWDDDVSGFIEDGFKIDNEHWHYALVRYANERGLIAN